VRERAIGILTEDPALYGELALFLKERKIPLVSLLPGKKIPQRVAVVVTSSGEAPGLSFEPKVVARPGRMLETWAAIQVCLGERSERGELIVGVDPGLRPGFAIVATGGRCIDQGVVESPESVVTLCTRLRQTFPRTPLIFRVGNGDHVRCSRIVNSLLSAKARVEIVDERRTTPHGRRDNDPISALVIASSQGKRVSARQSLHITQGDVGDVQRLSREHSGGRYTIPRELASAVLEGRMSLSQAVEKAGRGKRITGKGA
jgi:hypothetical protein